MTLAGSNEISALDEGKPKCAILVDDEQAAQWLAVVVSQDFVCADISSADLVVASTGRLSELPSNLRVPVIALGGDGERLQCSFLVNTNWEAEQLRQLLVSMVKRLPYQQMQPRLPVTAMDAEATRVAIQAAQRVVGAASFESIGRIVPGLLLDLVGARNGYCFFCESPSVEGVKSIHPSRGLVGFAARTGQRCVSQDSSKDPRGCHYVDNPTGSITDRVLVVPVVEANNLVRVVLVLSREQKAAPFDDREVTLVELFGQYLVPFLAQAEGQMHARSLLAEGQKESFFRKQALEAQGEANWGDAIRVTPRWLGAAYWGFVACVVVAVGFLVCARVSTYSSGHAVIRALSNTAVVTRREGVVHTVNLNLGGEVAQGDVVATLEDASELATLARIRTEFETQLRNHLLRLDESAIDASLRDLRHEMDLHQANIDECVIRAPRSGVLGDVRVRPGQHVRAGDVIASIGNADGALEVFALLPGEDRPKIAVGMQAELMLSGYRYAPQLFVIDAVSSNVLSQREASGVLGYGEGDGQVGQGAVVLVRGKLISNVFNADGKLLRLHDGMTGTVDLKIASEPAIFALIPGMRGLGGP